VTEYGKELIMDLERCNIAMFNRRKLKIFFVGLCEKINMKRAPLHFWDYGGDRKARAEAEPHLAGVTAIQFIETSDIRVHALDKLATVYVNVFSCKDFDVAATKEFIVDFFGGVETNSLIVKRGIKT